MKEMNYAMEISRLIARSFSQTLTQEEQEHLNEWLKASDSHRKLYERLRSGEGRKEREVFFQEMDKKKAWKRIEHATLKRKQQLLRLLSSAAAILILLASSIFIYMHRTEEAQHELFICTEEIKTGEEKAELVFADGLTIKLDSSAKRALTVKAGVQMTFENGNLSYQHEDSIKQVEFHTLKVPRGGFFSVTLDDGSVVYLNSSSSLRYPLQFGKEERRVYLEGEAFFEIKSDSNRSFHVVVDDLDICAYGTTFNVNTHQQGNIQTLLIEGKVGLNRKNRKEVILQPEQLASYNIEKDEITLTKVDPQIYTAWKNGWFIFENTTLEEVFRQLERWYDVDIIYLDKPKKEQRIFARVKRTDSIDIILKAMVENVNIHFKVEGKNILVYK